MVTEQFAALAGRFDALVSPSLGVVAAGVDERFSYMSPSAFGTLNFAGVLAGSPTVSVLNGLDADGLPTGIQLAGARFRENTILDAARTLEQRTGTTGLRPDGPRGTHPRASAARSTTAQQVAS